MSEAYTTCVRGCVRARKHGEDCDGDLCRGCEPRRAERGLLCWPCHRRLGLMLEQADIAERWLRGNLPAGQSAARLREEHERVRSGNDGRPTPINLGILDLLQRMEDQLAAWVDDLCEQHDLHGPDTHSIVTDSTYLVTWLDRCEQFPWIGDWFEELAETMRDAHALAPWRPGMSRIANVPCPECHETSLVIYGGEEDVTCQGCRLMIPPARYEIWARIAEEERAKPA